MSSRALTSLRALGPGLLFAGTAVGVSHLVQSTRAGADFGLALLWLVLLANLLKYPAFEAGSRYTAATGRSLLDGYRLRGLWALVLYLVLTIATMCIVLAAVTLITAAMASVLLTSALAPWQWSGIILVTCAGLLVVGRFKALEWVMRGLMLLLTGSTLVAVIALVPQVDTARLVLWPPLPEWTVVNVTFLVGLVGWMPSAIDIAVWQSLWGMAKARSEGRRIGLRESLFDFNVGYAATAFLAVCFVFLGAAAMYGSGKDLAAMTPPKFAAEFIGLYASAFGPTLGPLLRPVVLVAAFATMLSTTLSVSDGFPRALQSAIARIPGPRDDVVDGRGLVYWACLGICGAGALGIIYFASGTVGALIDFATVASFVTGPILMALNLRAVTAAEVPAEGRPGRMLLALHWIGLVSMSLFTAYYLYFRLSVLVGAPG